MSMILCEDNSRSLEDINEVLQLAKLKESEIHLLSQTVYFTDNNLHNNSYKLMQLDGTVLDSISEGQILYIKGEKDENAVICTDKQTFEVNDTETSNSLLLVENMKLSPEFENLSDRTTNKVVVHGIFHNYLELNRSKPHFKKLKDLLEKSVYKGPEHEFITNNNDLVTFDDLNKCIQSSRNELEEALKNMDIVVLNNKVRLLDFEYHFRVLSYMLKLIDENSWELDEINFDETLNALSDLVPNDILNCLFDKYAEESKIIDGLQLYHYKEDEICKFFAKVLLSQAGKFNLNEFLQAWRESVPEGIIPDEYMLNGIAIIDRKSVPNVIWPFPEDQLPENIIDRFKALFEAKEKWTVSEISPYIKNLATEKLDVNALLSKYSRASSVDGVKYFCSKHGK